MNSRFHRKWDEVHDDFMPEPMEFTWECCRMCHGKDVYICIDAVEDMSWHSVVCRKCGHKEMI